MSPPVGRAAPEASKRLHVVHQLRRVQPAGVIEDSTCASSDGRVDWRIWDRMVCANAVLGWFQKIEHYWVGESGLRPIAPADWHFLKSAYRQRFQTLLDGSDANALEEGWRDTRSTYHWFHLACRNALRALAARECIRWIARQRVVLDLPAERLRSPTVCRGSLVIAGSASLVSTSSTCWSTTGGGNSAGTSVCGR